MSFSAQTYKCATASSTACWISVSTVLMACPISSCCVDWSFQTAARAKPARPEIGIASDASFRFLRRRATGATPEHRALEERVAHHPVPAVRAAGDLARRVEALGGRLAVLVDHQAAVLVVEHRVGEDRLGQR